VGPDPGTVACVEGNLERFRVDLQVGDEVLLAEQLIEAGKYQLLDPFSVALDRRDPEGGQGGPDALGMLDEAGRNRAGFDDRVAPVIEADQLREKLGAEPMTIAANAVDVQCLAHQATATFAGAGIVKQRRR